MPRDAPRLCLSVCLLHATRGGSALHSTNRGTYSPQGAELTPPSTSPNRRATRRAGGSVGWLVQISDLHISKFVATNPIIPDLVSMGHHVLRQLRPDKLLLTGDLVDGKTARECSYQWEVGLRAAGAQAHARGHHASLPASLVDCCMQHAAIDRLGHLMALGAELESARPSQPSCINFWPAPPPSPPLGPRPLPRHRRSGRRTSRRARTWPPPQRCRSARS
jgi:hypothetical protein